MCRQGIALCDMIFHHTLQSFRCRIISFQSKIMNLNMYILKYWFSRGTEKKKKQKVSM